MQRAFASRQFGRPKEGISFGPIKFSRTAELVNARAAMVGYAILMYIGYNAVRTSALLCSLCSSLFACHAYQIGFAASFALWRARSVGTNAQRRLCAVSNLQFVHGTGAAARGVPVPAACAAGPAAWHQCLNAVT